MLSRGLSILDHMAAQWERALWTGGEMEASLPCRC